MREKPNILSMMFEHHINSRQLESICKISELQLLKECGYITDEQLKEQKNRIEKNYKTEHRE